MRQCAHVVETLPTWGLQQRKDLYVLPELYVLIKLVG